jgi:hypothetical protein
MQKGKIDVDKFRPVSVVAGFEHPPPASGRVTVLGVVD